MAGRQASRDLTAARRVLDLEADSLRALAKMLNDDFAIALDRLAKVEGRIIVTGMGKSGHIARKIAATLSSTGTPAQFVHPGEASHGDLGMITGKDAIIALSNSGNTAELADIIAYSRRFSIPLIAITGRGESQLAEAADMVLALAEVPEACPMGLAPTTSTTMMLALGDAIAVALLERKGFSTQQFQILHPGGALGRRLLHVGDIMHSGDGLPLCGEATPMAEAILVMTEKSLGCIGIVGKSGRLVGVITDGDLRRHMSTRLLELTAGEVMTAKPLTIPAQALADEAVGIMEERRITSLFIVEDGRPVGLLHIHDCLRAGVI